MKPRNILLIILLAAALIACGGRISQQTGDSDLLMAAEAAATQVGQTNLIITLQEADGAPVEDATLAVKGDMNHAGMVPVLADVTGGPGGVYEVPFRWTMSGDWSVTITAELPDGRFATRQFDFTITAN